MRASVRRTRRGPPQRPKSSADFTFPSFDPSPTTLFRLLRSLSIRLGCCTLLHSTASTFSKHSDHQISDCVRRFNPHFTIICRRAYARYIHLVAIQSPGHPTPNHTHSNPSISNRTLLPSVTQDSSTSFAYILAVLQRSRLSSSQTTVQTTTQWSWHEHLPVARDRARLTCLITNRTEQ